MFKKFLPLLILLLSGKALAYDFPIEIMEYIDNVKIIAYINKNDLNKTSEWTPFKSSLPLSVTDALAAIQNYFNANSAFSDMVFKSIELKPIPHHESNWHYIVKVTYKMDGNIRPHFFIVLMNGKVISAIKKPEAIK